MIMVLLLLILLWFILLIIGHAYVLQRCLNKDRWPIFIMLTSYIRLYPVYMFYQLPNCVRIADRYVIVAICHSNWLYSHKYRTVWYHPVSSRFYLTVFILCQFQGKLTCTLPDSDAWATCVKPGDSACYVLGVRCWFYVNTLFGTPGGTLKLNKMPDI
jgi:hypothetical protein